MSLESALSDYGLIVTSIIADGEIHRCGTRKKPKGKNGWYIIYDGGAAACYGNWETGDGYEYWNDGKPNAAIDSERINQLKKKRESAYESAAKEAQEFVDACANDGFSDYLKKKRCYPHGAKFDKNALIIPLQDAAGNVWSYQRILPNGDKYFMPGGRVKGCYFLIAGRNVSKDELVVVCEGFATGAAIHQVTKLPVVVAFNAGNIKPVCDSLVFRNLIIAADNDGSGVGEKAAKESGYKYVMPKAIGKDYSDLFLDGIDFKGDFIQPSQSKKNDDLIAHGIVGQIADWITETAIHPQPKLSLAAALGFVAMLRGHKICGGTDLRTNLLIMSMSPTGGGKDHPQKCIIKLAHATGYSKHMLGEPVSGGGFLTGLTAADRVGLLVIDEVGRFLGNISNKNSGGYQKEIVDYIIKTFSCANSTLYGRQHVDTKKNPRIDINQPHFCCVGSSVKEKIKQSCTSADVLDGFLNRWIVFDADKYVERKSHVNRASPPQGLIDAIAECAGKVNYDSYGEPVLQEVSFTPEAWDMFTAYREQMDRLVKTSGHPINALYNRSCEHVEKIALTLSDGEFIGTRDLQLAIDIVTQSNAAILEFVGLISDNVFEDDFIKVREKIRDAGEMQKSQLTYKCQFVTGGSRRVQEIVNILLDSNLIAERVDGRRTYYKWIG